MNAPQSTARDAAAGAQNPPLLEARNVTCAFAVGGGTFRRAKKLLAVDDVSLTVRRGEALGIVGESGSGKTTLGRALLGLLRPASGSILLDAQPIDGIDRINLTRRIQPVFQDPYSSLNPRKTIEEIISLPLLVHAIGAAGSRTRAVAELMEHVGLSRRLLHTYPNQLSGGQRQRVAIARALAIRPEIIVCDEPTSALDVSVQAQILNLLQDLREEFGLTYVFISHDLGVIEHIADRVAVMYLGRLVEAGASGRILSKPRHPYTRALLESVLTPDPALGVPELHLRHGYPDPLNPPPGCHFHPRCVNAMPECKQRLPRTLRDADGLVECHLFDSDGNTGAA